MAYTIIDSDDAERQLKALSAGTERELRREIKKYLSDQPNVESNIRKHLRPNPIAE